jgi:hypothetical protein
MSTPTQHGDTPIGSSPAMPRPANAGPLDCDTLAVSSWARIVAIIDRDRSDCRDATSAAPGFC